MSRQIHSPSDGTGDSIEDLNKVMKTLLSHEIWWRDRCHFLESCGYQLRPRFRPGWVSSWRGTGKSAIHFEDSHSLRVWSSLFLVVIILNIPYCRSTFISLMLPELETANWHRSRESKLETMNLKLLYSLLHLSCAMTRGTTVFRS